jgi:hypothetical protein
VSKVDAEVTIKFIISDVCTEEDLEDGSLQEMVEDAISSDGLYELFVESEEYQVVDVKPIH